MKHDTSESRYLRKKYAKEGYDQEQEQQEQQFGQNLQKALDTYGKKGKKKDIQCQVQYFGNMIEPFNMREEQEMGDIDQEGYFVFKRRGEYRDAWLDSIEEGNDMMVADKVKKKIKIEGVTYKGVYDEDKGGDRPDDQKINQVDKEQENEQNQQNDNLNQEYGRNKYQQEYEQSDQKLTLQPSQIKLLLSELLPMNKSANAYIKQLKKNIKNPQTKQLHDKILELCNMYIQKTNEYDILTSKKEQLQIQVGGGVEDEEKSDEINWDDDGQQHEQKNEKNENHKESLQKKQQNTKNNRKETNNKTNTQNNQMKQSGNYSDDDIF